MYINTRSYTCTYEVFYSFSCFFKHKITTCITNSAVHFYVLLLLLLLQLDLTAVIILFCYSYDYDKRTLDNYITQNDVQVVKYTQRRIQKYTDDDDEIRIV